MMKAGRGSITPCSNTVAPPMDLPQGPDQTVWPGLLQHPVQRGFQIVLLIETVAGEWSTATAKEALVINEHIKSPAAKQRDVLDHTNTGVGETVQHDDGLLLPTCGSQVPDRLYLYSD